MIIRGYIVAPLVKQTIREIVEDRIPSLAAETAYYFFFSLFPLLLFLTPLLGVVGDGPALMESLLARMSATLPADALSLLRRTLGEIVTSSGGGGVMTLGALLAAWSGSNIFASLMNALNVAYDVSETRPLWKRVVLRLACVVIAGVVVLLATAVFLDGERLAKWVGASDLEHVGKHQEQALGRRERRAERALLYGAVKRPGCASLGLHLDDLGNRTPEVGPSGGAPGVGVLAHGRGGGDRVDRDHLAAGMSDVGGSLVAVDTLPHHVCYYACQIARHVILRCPPCMHVLATLRTTKPEAQGTRSRCAGPTQ